MLSAIAVLFLSNNKFFADVMEESNGGANLFVDSDLYTAIASLFVVLTTALQYVLKLEVKTRDAKRAGNDFTNIKREIEFVLVNGPLDAERINAIHISHTHASRNHDLVPSSAWQKAKLQTNVAFKEDSAFEQTMKQKYDIPDEIGELG